MTKIIIEDYIFASPEILETLLEWQKEIIESNLIIYLSEIEYCLN